MNIKDLIKDNSVHFIEYRKGYLYYYIEHLGEWNNNIGEPEAKHYKFSIPPEDAQDGTFKAHDRAVLYMRWIKRAIDSGELVEI